jgi:sec-independent protein translocase protein TatC
MARKSGLRKSDDLFEKSSMSFGEHLEELRRTLGKALFWLVVGLCISMPFANTVVVYIQTPLVDALEKYYLAKNQAEYEAKYGEQLSGEFQAWMAEKKFASETVFFDREKLAVAVGNSVANLPPLEATTGDAEIVALTTDPDVPDPITSAEETPVQRMVDQTDDDTAEKSKKADEAKKTDEVSSAATDAQGDETTFEGPAKAKKSTSSAPVSELTSENLIPIDIWRKIEANTEALSLQEPFIIWFKAALVTAVIIASPGIFWHLWAFVSAGLYPHERKYVYFFLPLSIGLFLAGVALAFYVIFGYVLNFLLSFNSALGIGATPRLNDYMSFALVLPLGFGVAFQLPLVMFVLERLGLISVELYIKNWRVAILIIAFLSMILTPGELTSMIGLLVPMVFLYYMGIGLCKFVPRGNTFDENAYDPE